MSLFFRYNSMSSSDPNLTNISETEIVTSAPPEPENITNSIGNSKF